MKNYELVKTLEFSNRCILLNINQSNNYSITESIVGEQLNQFFFDQQLNNIKKFVEEYEEEQEKETQQFKQLELEIEEHLKSQAYEQQLEQMKSQKNDKENDNKFYQSNKKVSQQQLQSKSSQSQQEQFINSKQSNQIEQIQIQQNSKQSLLNNQFDMFSEEDLDEYFKAREDKIVKDQQQSALSYNKFLQKDDEFSYNSPTQQATLYSTPQEFQKSNLISERSNFNSKQNYFQIVKKQRDEDIIQDVPFQRKTSCFNYTDQQHYQFSNQSNYQNNSNLLQQSRVTSQQPYKSPNNEKINKSFDALDNMSYFQQHDHKIFSPNTQRPLTPQNKVTNNDSVQSKNFAQINYLSEKPKRKRIFDELKPAQISQLYSTNKSPNHIQVNNEDEFDTLDIKDFYQQIKVEIQNQKYQNYSNFAYLQKRKK